MTDIEKLQSQARVIQEKISAIQSAETRKENGSKVGKFYRTRNNYSCPEKPSDYWWLYSEVTRMDRYGYLYANQFQTDNRGNIRVDFDTCAMHMTSSDWRPITEEQYKKAWAKLVTKTKTLV